MYKPNGEEPMTKSEEMRRRQALASRASERLDEHARQDASPESLRSAFYAAMYRSHAMREDGVAALGQAH